MKVSDIKCKMHTLNINYGNMWKLHVLNFVLVRIWKN